MAENLFSDAQREQAHRIFELVRGFDVQDMGTEAHERFLEEFYWELNMFTILRAATLEAQVRLGAEGQAAAQQEEARQVHEAYLEDIVQRQGPQVAASAVIVRPPVPITMIPLRRPGTDSLVFSQTRNSGQLQFPSSVEPSYLESVNGQCSICAREYNDYSSIHELTNGNLVSVLRTCKHVFHFDCLLQWFAVKNNCPLCRTLCF